MGNHYLPQFYLRGFSRDGALWAHDRKESRSFKSQPKAVANENAMYPPELEQLLANQIEDPAKSAIEAARAHQELSQPQREALARYIAALWRRVPLGRARALSHVPGLVAEVRDELCGGLDAAAGDDPTLLALAREKKAWVAGYLATYENDRGEDLWHLTLGEPASERVIESLLSMRWTFLVDPGRGFITCDNPVFFFEEEGIGSPSSELSLPFSSDVALWATRQGHDPCGRFRNARKEDVRQLNRRSAHNADRFIYTECNQPWMLRFACKGSYTLSRRR